MDAANLKKRQYFKDLMLIMAILATVIDVYNQGSAWLPHVQTVLQHYQTLTLRSAMIPALIPPGSKIRTSNPTLHGRLILAAPQYCHLVQGVHIRFSAPMKLLDLGQLRRFNSTLTVLIPPMSAPVQHMDK